MSFLSGIGDVLKSVTGAIGDIVSPISGILDAGLSYLSGSQAADTQEKINQQNLQIARETNAFNAQQAGLNREWGTYMSSTAYQRAVPDMINAGLNPMLAYQQGGAAVPGGSSASGVTATMQNPKLAGAQAAAATAEIANRVADVQLKQSQADVNRAQVPQIQAQTMLTTEQQNKIKAEVEVLDRAKFTEEWRARLEQVRGELAEYQLAKMNPLERAELAYKVKLIEYSLDAAKNTSEGQKKWAWYMQNVAPLLPDLLKSTTAAGHVGSAMRPRPRALIFGR